MHKSEKKVKIIHNLSAKLKLVDYKQDFCFKNTIHSSLYQEFLSHFVPITPPFGLNKKETIMRYWDKYSEGELLPFTLKEAERYQSFILPVLYGDFLFDLQVQIPLFRFEPVNNSYDLLLLASFGPEGFDSKASPKGFDFYLCTFKKSGELVSRKLFAQLLFHYSAQVDERKNVEFTVQGFLTNPTEFFTSEVLFGKERLRSNYTINSYGKFIKFD